MIHLSALPRCDNVLCFEDLESQQGTEYGHVHSSVVHTFFCSSVAAFCGKPVFCYRSSSLQPEDARMWNAMGICYQAESINRPEAAIKCFERSLTLGDEEGVSVVFLARLYEKSGMHSQAAHYFELCLKRLDDQHIEGKDVVEALTFLADYYKAQGKFPQSERYCLRLMDLGGPEREKAKQLMRQLRGHFGSGRGDVDLLTM